MLTVCLRLSFHVMYYLKQNKITKLDQSISLTAVGFCQSQRKHFSLILHKAPLSTKEPSFRAHLPA